ncbi:permease, cytosine/purines, uracil, thiamine, allantoin family protein [Leptolyngbya boryana NIES-2135]|jgi:cytosine permease|uniref:Permease, cytosine/purines, uracil, thiamine, allantoin family protein n=1 Tax=Leptolyngbya boryana NIES-2135 TaxID=1973484 RepID=A0A1Z4JQ41_LEPBY|nr:MULTISPECIES: cytosine permease [Leptolyngbya]BAY58758.1 permease, cytosine/purines, uracil, thiamine, allantoin family protein [Leptolyngbya boryana NIES-2135]MBD2370221.1 cytosine permease [Leptolyngbya sp. FACHB-161]MBD2376567.1 cytosine permease [Leptolyngbya sp. FACHB-238]MBD2400839.1 cytosine permease [Leptolyngbya sp. FACHB-239]MBD2407383.1 cytosine permease [Leptolyngbya sp. FACHB-402]
MSLLGESQVADRTQASQDYPLAAVPLSDRKPIWSLAPLLMGFALTSTTLLAGGTLGSSLRFADMIWVMLIGNAVLGAYCAALAYIASKSGLSTVLMARFSFGAIGSRWVDFILGFTQIGWYAVTNAFIAQALLKLLNLPPTWEWLGIIFFTYAFCITAYMGYTAMDWLSRLAVPAMLMLIALSLTLGFRDAGDLFALAPTKSLGMNEAIAIVIATFISGGTQATNWSRFADSTKNAVWSTWAAFFFINGLLIFTGAFCTLVYGTNDLIEAMAKQGLLLGGLVLLILNVWTTQDNTIYAFSIAGSNFFRTSKRTAFVLGGSTLALALALGGIYGKIIPFLLFLGTVIPPVGGIIMADYWLCRGSRFPSLDTQLPAFNWAGIIAYIVASAIAYFSGLAGVGVAPINGVISAAILYVILSRILPNSMHV